MLCSLVIGVRGSLDRFSLNVNAYSEMYMFGGSQ